VYQVAIKVIDKRHVSANPTEAGHIEREIAIYQRLRHPNCVRMLHRVVETALEIWLVLEFCGGGELFDLIVANGRTDERIACDLFHQLINGIEYCHGQHIVQYAS
jgi:serine/threonine protein kinase